MDIGHLSLRLEGAHPSDVAFLFEQQQKRLGPAFLISLAYHIAMFLLIVIALRYGTHSTTAAGPVLPETTNARIIWLNEPGPGGGGGGGGNRMPEPPRRAEVPGKDKLTVPVSKPPLEPQKPATKEPASSGKTVAGIEP